MLASLAVAVRTLSHVKDLGLSEPREETAENRTPYLPCQGHQQLREPKSAQKCDFPAVVTTKLFFVIAF